MQEPQHEMELHQFDQCAQTLEADGYALLSLPQHGEVVASLSQAFATARWALDVVSKSRDSSDPSETTGCKVVPLIDPESDSASWTGYHCAASTNGRYNEFREGFVFSNGEMFDIQMRNHKADLDCISAETQRSFGNEMNEMFHIMHDVIADGILRAIERRLQLPHLYFKTALGPTDNSSQWHMKRYVVDSSSLERQRQGSNETLTLLPVHTDPSLISVVVVDQRGVNTGGMGLEVFHSKTCTWEEISHHGHAIAIIFVGSVLSHLTPGQSFPAAKHRVVRWWSDETLSCKCQRVVATLFVRPHGDARMKPLASPLLQCEDDQAKNYMTFRQWNSRVARNYMKKKRAKTWVL
ncbi:hypothetical protein HJC23_005448 [Cyclotella cryptica]|uniref:Fe2OG dioxygenase domain-containing protein n=1 Tax=Cyclotella cryptica TaxID=29204 RepID=A0ABD3P790_9STRA|eukprot:CCRYP_017903-RB/>CCRYP_017903-RB protein AED:0.01 eAED:0.01 QI:239/-1/1/1/-1/1/1/143/351